MGRGVHRRGRGSYVASLALLLAALSAAGCDPIPREAARQGTALYARHCAECHGPRGEGQDPRLPLGVVEPGAPMLAPALNATGHCTDHSPGELVAIIRDGGLVPGSPMPAWGAALNEEELRALTGYIYTLWPLPVRRTYRARHGEELRALFR